jgi:hypothetical protein
VVLTKNEYRLSKVFEDNSEADPESVLQKLYLHFATDENLPHRVAYESADFVAVGCGGDEPQFPA